MTSLLGELNWHILLIYFDDIIIYSRSLEEHLLHLQLVFNRLRAADLKLNPSKCVFARAEVHYLGFVVGSEGIKPALRKIEAIQQFPRPTTEQILTRANSKFSWTYESCEHAFCVLKDRLTSPPVLAYPDFKQEFTVETDASDLGLGAVLTQGKKVIAYVSRALTTVKRIIQQQI